jgi:hypothetical protein
MRLAIDPMPVLRRAKADEVTVHFNQLAIASAHTDHAYAQKRLWAATRDARLEPEAALRGLSVDDLAALILAKPDKVQARELARVTLLTRIAVARTPGELNAIVANADGA